MATAELPAGRRIQLRAPVRKVTAKCAQLAGKARAWRLHLAVPSLAGAGLVSAGLALRFGIWAGLIAGGIFCLILDHRVT